MGLPLYRLDGLSLQRRKPREAKSPEGKLSATRILREYWGPPSGQHKQTQRLFIVELSDGTKETLLAEDTVDRLPDAVEELPFEQNPFYKQVLEAWRREALHQHPPVQPTRDEGCIQGRPKRMRAA